MLWHLSKDANDNATLSNRPYQILRGHTSALTSGSINKTCQTAVTVSSERLVLIHRIEEAPPNGQHELLGDLPLVEIKCDEMSLLPSITSASCVHTCIVTAAGVIVCVVNKTTLITYDINDSKNFYHPDLVLLEKSEEKKNIAVDEVRKLKKLLESRRSWHRQ